MAVKVFSIEEANSLIPLIEKGIRFLVKSSRAVRKLQDQVSVLSVIGAEDEKSTEHEENSAKKRRLAKLIGRHNRKVDELQGYGCIIKDLRRGLVDFYGVKDGRLIFLCWKLGEKRVGYWHELNGGFRGRRPLSEL
ncbi:MAG: DUF2203 family protein [Candidatus Eisenbacteria bacterium]|nr:DUF2203 family protein [Candidatus Eisenbacteria bacterium]